MGKKVGATLSVFTLFMLLTFRPSGAESNHLKFGVFPSQETRTLIKLFLPLARSIEANTGRRVELVSAPDRKQFNKRTIDGEYDIIWTCNACYLKVHEKAGYKAIARGSPSFRGVACVRKDGKIKSLKDMKGKKIAAVGRHSIAGYLFIRNKLADLGIDVEQDLTVEFLGKSESIPFLVYDKHYDVGVFSEDAFIRSTVFESIRKDLEIIEVSQAIPQFPFAVRPDMDKKTVDLIRDALTGSGSQSPEYIKSLKILRYEKVIGANDNDYDEFRKMYYEVKNYKPPKKDMDN